MQNNNHSRNKIAERLPAMIPWQVRLYRASALILSPFILLHMIRRRLAGQERDLFLRFGLSWSLQRKREEGTKLIWMHGASIGESLAALTLSQLLSSVDPNLRFIITSGTITGATVLSARISSRPEENKNIVAATQAPMDFVFSIRRFLWAWQPDAFIAIESEIWPNMIWECRSQGMTLMLVDARMSARSEKRWNSFSALRNFMRRTLEQFSLVLCQTSTDAQRLKQLGARAPVCTGSVKATAPAPPVDAARLTHIQNFASNQDFWLASSTHHGEDDIVLDAHAIMVGKWQAERAHRPPPCLVIIPRHPHRAGAVKRNVNARFPEWIVRMQLSPEEPLLDEAFLSQDTACKSGSGQTQETRLDITADRRKNQDGCAMASTRQRPQVVIAGYLGATALWMSEADLCVVGGSLVPNIGGHNVMEPALLHCAVLHGPHMENARNLVEGMLKRDADSLLCVGDASDLGNAVWRLFLREDERNARIRAAHAAAVALGGDVRQGILERVMRALKDQ
jgi:3-deoxy-D-manno-octulosonic-acid transferase